MASDSVIGPNQGVAIHIDRKKYEAPSPQMTGTEIRQLAGPPVGDDRDLWQEVPGDADVPVGDEDLVDLKNGMHFFTAPRTINPG